MRTKRLMKPAVTVQRSYGRFVDTKNLLSQLASTTVTRFGIEMLHDPVKKTWRPKSAPDKSFESQQELIRWVIGKVPRTFCQGRFSLFHHNPHWRLCGKANNETVDVWLMRPQRKDIADAIRAWRKNDSRPSFRRPDTLGWRGWDWDGRNYCLKSPSQGTLWPEPEMRVENFETAAAVRGVTGIHACRLPKGDWRKANRPDDFLGAQVIGLVERFGKFVLGKEGWRAEWVLIRELLAPDEVVARALRRAYPEIPVSVAHKGHWLRGR